MGRLFIGYFVLQTPQTVENCSTSDVCGFSECFDGDFETDQSGITLYQGQADHQFTYTVTPTNRVCDQMYLLSLTVPSSPFDSNLNYSFTFDDTNGKESYTFTIDPTDNLEIV